MNDMEKVFSIIDASRDEMIATLSRWIKIPSVQGDALEGMPFGENNQKMLEEAQRTAGGMGFDTRNVDNYLLEVNYGEGERTLGILGHMDVVPEGEGWSHAPYGAEIEDGRMYGRGTSDDKGPMVSALYALKAVRDAGIELKDKIRVLLGLNEETGSADIAYYKRENAMPDYGFSPDADYPVINCEKGGLGINLDGELKKGAGAFEIKSIKCGTRVNIVPNLATAMLNISAAQCKELLAKTGDLAKALEVAPGETEGECLLTAHGTASHAAMPENGVNAAGTLCMALDAMGAEQPVITALAKLLGLEYTGEKLGIKMSDEVSGVLTCNFGILTCESGHVLAMLDIRYPISAKSSELLSTVANTVAPYGIASTLRGDSKPLYVPEDHFVVQGLLRAYERVTGEKGYTIAIGGGTYARSMDNAVAFGNAYPGTDNRIHMPDEFVNLDEFVRNAKMIAAAIIELAGK